MTSSHSQHLNKGTKQKFPKSKSEMTDERPNLDRYFNDEVYTNILIAMIFFLFLTILE